MENTYVPMARSENIVIQEMPASEKGPSELLVYDLTNNRAHCLNETAALIWKQCDGSSTVSEIASNLNSSGGADLVWLGIDQLSKENLLVESHKPASYKPNRREIIKKVGIASAIAIPIVSSLAAPSSVMAAASCTCVTSADCVAQPACVNTCQPTGICA